MAPVPKAKKPKRPSPRSCLGPVADLEQHLPAEWWRKLFNALYVKTDGDVVENNENTRREVDFIVSTAAIQPHSAILDLCCGQGRHCLELARRGFKNVSGVDRSRYLIRLAKKRAQTEGLQVVFKEGDARNPRLPESSFDCVAIMGNSFGYFSNKQDDEKVLTTVGKLLRPSGQIVLDITDGAYMADHFDRRSWEWIDEHHFVCRERSLSADRERLISREVIVHDEIGVIADQFYAERLYTKESIGKLLERCGFRNIRYHGSAESVSDRDQDLGMMARRLLLSADAPQLPARKPRGKLQQLDVTVLLGDPRLPDQVKRGGAFQDEDMETVRRLKDALAELTTYKFRYLDNHATLDRDLADLRTDLVFNLCDEGFNNDPFKELHVPAMLDALGLPYTGGAPAALAACYDKGLVRAVAMTLDVPVPLETYVRPGDQGATLPSVFPALLKPNTGDSSQGITMDAVVSNEKALLDYLERLRAEFPKRSVLVQEFLTGAEYSVGLIGNPDQGLRALPILEVDYSKLDPNLPKILGYESKWEPESPYWTQIRYQEASLSELAQQQLVEHSTRLFERLGCRDYARFDFRADSKGELKLLEVNPNPGWCWDGKLNIMAGFQGMRYPELLAQILQAAVERLNIVAKPQTQPAEAAQ
ncbi:MAG: methyltransferase domain-containing protein [Hyphomicrobium zavarzinii]|jgi:D-alanine-D-alanine ligase|uniref:methyltransferase domain-containing protein n=1 Tax=Hyphomicrobium TaxID=81 RepID=UPI0003828077|nr:MULTISPECIES: methyltransferase domain-containing protein [Hyphomicrobium]MBL8844701.1 methyltransferase domain-containing protein [Hyphomicrobium zavarzinii]WBT39383.1 methyltransferase domain-containing protein [Hyphomicrobium sp. DMF-1]HML44197.1 methyltransferase domain-containing protein [Hyphomicrobium zavarzinii]